MDLEFSDEQEELRASVRRLLDDRAPRSWVRSSYGDPTHDGEVWKALADLGVHAVLAPEEAGGLGLALADAAVIAEELGRALYPGPYAASSVGAVWALQQIGDTGQVARLAEGGRITVPALLEPDRGYRWRSPQTSASWSGGCWRLRGSKLAVPAATTADSLLVPATVDGRTDLFAVEREAEGVSVAPVASVDGTRALGDVRRDDAEAQAVAVDAEAVLSAMIDRTTTVEVLDALGAASVALEMSVTYAGEREQFGRPIGAFQAVQHLCADMLLDLELLRASAYNAVAELDGDDPHAGHVASTMAAALAVEVLPRLGANAVQVHGGIGFTWEHDVGLYHRRLLGAQQALGTPATRLRELAGLVL